MFHVNSEAQSPPRVPLHPPPSGCRKNSCGHCQPVEFPARSHCGAQATLVFSFGSISFWSWLRNKSFWPLTTIKTHTLDQVAGDGEEPRDSSGAVGKARSSGSRVWEGLDVTCAYLPGLFPPYALPLPPAFPTARKSGEPSADQPPCLQMCSSQAKNPRETDGGNRALETTWRNSATLRGTHFSFCCWKFMQKYETLQIF